MSAGDEHVLGGARHLRSRQVSGEAGVSLRSARRFWRALGFPNVDDALEAFTDADVAALHRVASLVRAGVVDEATALAMTRAVGRSVDRLASWQLHLLAEVVAEQAAGEQADDLAAGPLTPDEEARRVADLITRLADDLEPLVVYAWRRHLASSLERFVTERSPQPDARQIVRSVGFADLVSFTSVVRRLSERDLGALVQHFEATASDIVASHGGRVIKTMGDEVLFVAQKVPAAAAIALDIATEMGVDEMLPEVRVGIATGTVVARLGDVFGTTVNRASRLTSIARPGAVLVDDGTAAVLGEMSGFSCQPLRRRSLRGLGPVSPWLLRRRSGRGG
ncbi:MAG TPA: adenylate/guanylate cyclase domain-containing protein [Actinomycetales bacterium]|nr:adenylate/guanylate cyclase domain-containing protein [Actinomycetales bacterium]